LTTTVILKGIVKLPEFFDKIPADIMEWVGHQKKIEVYENMADQTMMVFSTGMAKCHEDDKYDSLLGERLAEARAKYYIYKFFYDLCSRLCGYYNSLLYGECGGDSQDYNDGLMCDLDKYRALCIRESHHIGELLKSKENE
jgi:hypothetical protein